MQREESPAMATGLERIAAKTRSEATVLSRLHYGIWPETIAASSGELLAGIGGQGLERKAASGE